MRRLSSIFGDGSEKEDPAPQVDSFSVVYDDGRFCVLRLTFATNVLDVEPVELLAGAEVYGSIEPDEGDDRTVEFMLPSSAARGSFSIRLGEAGHPLPAPDDSGAPDATTTEDAHAAIQRQLVDQGRRLATLRASVRRERERAVRAEEALEEARESFDEGLLATRSDHHVLEQQVTELQATLADERGRRLGLERVLAPLNESIAALEAEREKLREDLGYEKSRRADLETELTKARKASEEASAKAKERVAELEQELNTLDDRRENAESALAETQAALGEERAAAADLTARAEAAEKALEQSRSAR